MATEDKGSVPSEEKIGMPERKSTSKRVNSLATFFKVWATPLTILIAVAGLLWSVYQFNLQQAENQAQALDQQRQATLDTYFDRMSDLLLMYHLGAPNAESDVLALAEARTFAALENLDGTRKVELIKFLWSAELIKDPHPIIVIPGADLSGAMFAGVNLNRINLIYVLLHDANLGNAIFAYANLSRADLSGADLNGTDLSNAILLGADLRGAHLSGANLSGAILGCSYGICTNLKGASYNIKSIQEKDAQGNPLTLQPTKWPQGFDPMSAGLNCSDC